MREGGVHAAKARTHVVIGSFSISSRIGFARSYGCRFVNSIGGADDRGWASHQVSIYFASFGVVLRD
ncbi:hypothetical protein [Ferrimicrobium sp.]|uniref:hypothetical protein n=1 Tax=Ferrimicrobium sp. TaxID=2926050 RepID=UPI002613E1DB|nr:hypothetical protein [Ferrimicrobium sp.]